MKDWKRLLRQCGPVGFWFVLLITLFVTPGFCGPPVQPPPGTEDPGKPASSSLIPVDVMVWVRPLDATSAHLAIAYSRREPHEQVRQALSVLAQAMGGVLSEVSMTDASLQPGATRRYPVTTTATFRLDHAAQWRDNAPQLDGYVAAFQNWNRIEILFTDVTPTTFQGVTAFEDDALSVDLLQQDVGLYRYDIRIRQHSGALPTLNQRRAAPQSQSIAAQGTSLPAHRATSVPVLAVGLMIAGAVLIVMPTLYLVLTRRGATRSYARSLRP